MTTTAPVEKPKHGCTGKLAFLQFAEADRRAKRIRERTGDPVAAYHCRHCHRYHVGGTLDNSRDLTGKDKRREVRLKVEKEQGTS